MFIWIISPPLHPRNPSSPRDRFQYSRADSRANLLNTPSTVWRSPRTPPPYSTTMSSPRKWWHWRPAWFMCLSFLFGVACAIGHHAFYTSLNGKPAVDQLCS
ncbi:hypothetical protein F4813DRAFT_365947 [Daldinia decipiens]|uniref:uncharacterized protein n=1 Tax=Daldinia decipiens TaxID=326647 RepID=UPI0020C4BACC|nr:uncharacterized protein F4813DRAFT_365947 [Daldinia decipiens]KAI1655976.1 hypothetical protein F4813DRAFT_365947 [Daldinia decipiens]